MTKTIAVSGASVLAATFAAALISTAPITHAKALSPMVAQDSNVAGDVIKKLDKKQFKSVKGTVDANGIVTLTGTVDLYEYKMDAAKRAQKVKGVSAVRNAIEVSGPSMSDAELQQKLIEKLQYDRVGYGNLFNAVSVGVQNGVVTLAGHARTDVDKDSALALVSTYSGVKDVVDEIEVDPVSIMDDQTRLAIARAVYGTPALQRYSIDPAKPIRISVQNGHVELSGVVDSQADKDMAYIKANQVPGVFSVKNDLQVAGGTTTEKPR